MEIKASDIASFSRDKIEESAPYSLTQQAFAKLDKTVFG